MQAEPKVTVLDPGQVRTTLAAAAAQAPVAVDEVTGAVWVFGYEEIDRLAHDPRLAGVGMTMFDLMGIEGELRRWYASLMFTNEGAEHLRLRRLVNRAFTPRSVERLRADTAASVAALLAELEDGGEGDLIALFGLLALGVMCRLLGVPADDLPVFAAWADALSPVFGFMEPPQIAAATSALGELLDYVGALVARRQDDPGDDLITALVQAEEAGDRLTRDEVVTMVANLLVGGHDTTSSQLGCSLLTLLEHPEALARVADGTADAAAVVTETMRYEPSIAGIPRTVTEPAEIGGVTRPAGTLALLTIMIGNRDPSVWEDPDVFLVDRFSAPSAPRLLSFGTGPHYCLGTNLARMTLEETVKAVAGRDLVLLADPEKVEWRQILGRSPVALPVRMG
jgi:cytochrome P450